MRAKRRAAAWLRGRQRVCSIAWRISEAYQRGALGIGYTGAGMRPAATARQNAPRERPATGAAASASKGISAGLCCAGMLAVWLWIFGCMGGDTPNDSGMSRYQQHERRRCKIRLRRIAVLWARVQFNAQLFRRLNAETSTTTLENAPRILSIGDQAAQPCLGIRRGGQRRPIPWRNISRKESLL